MRIKPLTRPSLSFLGGSSSSMLPVKTEKSFKNFYSNYKRTLKSIKKLDYINLEDKKYSNYIDKIIKINKFNNSLNLSKPDIYTTINKNNSKNSNNDYPLMRNIMNKKDLEQLIENIKYYVSNFYYDGNKLVLYNIYKGPFINDINISSYYNEKKYKE